jgi:trimethylamine-N-oxide reductase (cytochrome c)
MRPSEAGVKPLGESRNDYEVVCMVAEKLGILDKVTEGKNTEEWIRFGFEKSGVTNLISWEQFKEKKYFVVPVDPAWKDKLPKPGPGLRWYYELPEGAKLKTKSGKIEFYAQWLAEHFPDDPERPPVPHYIPYGETHQESVFHPRAKEFPFLLVSNHPRWRQHANCDDIPWLIEIPTCKIAGPDGYFYQVVWIHPIDASKKGIKHGDIVMLHNERGAVLGAAYVTERIMPSSLSQDHGARLDLISLEDRIDRAGSNNLITPEKTLSKNAGGMAVSAFLVDVKKVDIVELRKKYPEAFARKLYPVIGPYYDSWVRG